MGTVKVKILEVIEKESVVSIKQKIYKAKEVSDRARFQRRCL